jgi:putative phosphoesterase
MRPAFSAMRLAALSDTHVSCAEVGALCASLRPHLRGIDAILHAGDITCLALLDELRAIAPVHAVAGNMDGEAAVAELGERRVLALGSRRLGLIHGSGAPGDLSRRVVERFRGSNGKLEVEVVVFGHSHQPLCQQTSEVLLVNPGSPTDRRWAPYRSMALIDLGPTIEARIVRLP